jgi:initiation factor 1A
MLGNGRLEAMCFDGEKRLAHIRGKLRKKVWINQGDIILLSLRDYQDEKGDVILKYTADEARNLKAYGELPENAKINETDTFVSHPMVQEAGWQLTVNSRETKAPMDGSSSVWREKAKMMMTTLISRTSKWTQYQYYPLSLITSSYFLFAPLHQPPSTSHPLSHSSYTPPFTFTIRGANIQQRIVLCS